MEIVFVSLLSLFAFALLFILLYSLAQIQLVIRYLKAAFIAPISSEIPSEKVLIQLPIYNEPYVVERLITAVLRIKHPKHLLEIQVLDDSTDGSENTNRKLVELLYSQGHPLKYIHRENRIGYKAGALKDGLAQSDAKYIAIFDADFVPSEHFIEKTLPFFNDSKVGMVQSCWEHLNAEDSLMTRLQAFGLDAHFSVEQVGRNSGGNFINFNGTAGIWRRTCIEDAGNWSADTLTEDLDLSYRAQLKGWKFIYLEMLKSPAELPPIMSALRSQQYRWTKGGAETARKHLLNVLRSNKSWNDKIHAVFHLLNSSVFICIFLSAVISVPILLLKEDFPQYQDYFIYSSVFLISFISISVLYAVASIQKRPTKVEGWKYYLRYFPQFLAFSMGLSFHNAIAVSEAFLGRKTAFVRTPKFKNTKDLKGRLYLGRGITLFFWVELLLFFYFTAACIFAVCNFDYSLLLFHLFLASGYGLVVYHSLINPK